MAVSYDVSGTFPDSTSVGAYLVYTQTPAGVPLVCDGTDWYETSRSSN